jgi:uncharacterized membrane protein
MARSVEIVIPADRTETLLQEVERLDGVVGVRLQQGASRRPHGDVVTVLTTNAALNPLLRLLDGQGVSRDPNASIMFTEPSGVIAPASMRAFSADTTDIPWEEMEFSIARESNMSANALLLMLAAGVFAAVGVAISALHVVLAAMVIAPGFEPMVRISLGLVAGSTVWRMGLRDVALGYGALIGGGILAGAVMMAMGRALPMADATYLPRGELLAYWTTISGPGVLVSVFAAGAGAVLVANNRSVLTAGVMIALSLVPTAAIAGLALLTADATLLMGAIGRWLVDAVLVVVMSILVFMWKGTRVQQRKMVA